MSVLPEIRKSSDLKTILNAHNIFPFVRKAQQTGHYSIQFHDKGLERGTDPAETWVERIKAVLPGIEILETTDHHAHWKTGNPVLIATIWANFPQIDFVSYYIIMMQLEHIIKKRLILMAIRLWSFIKWWKKFVNHLIYTPKLTAPQTQVIPLPSMPITDHIRLHGKQSARQVLHLKHHLKGVIAQQQYIDGNPAMEIPGWEDLPTGQVITVHLNS